VSVTEVPTATAPAATALPDFVTEVVPEVAEAPLALSIAEVAERTGVTAHTLRYYERIGLVSVPRDEVGRRVYTADEIGRVLFITRLRQTAMPIRQIQDYFRLVAEGPGTEPQRLALLERHRADVQARMRELQSALEAVEYKIAVYGGSCGS
jgi:DNA-binding transcriptional MerR regulator